MKIVGFIKLVSLSHVRLNLIKIELCISEVGV